MSSTNRGVLRQPDDFYQTPALATRAILPYLDLRGRILEPGCGNGAIVREIVSRGVRPDQIRGVELNQQRANTCFNATGIDTYHVDYLTHPIQQLGKFDLAIGNPPFSF